MGKLSIIHRLTKDAFLTDSPELKYEGLGDGWEETGNEKYIYERLKVGSKKKATVRVFIKAAARAKEYTFRTQSFRNPYR